MHDLTLTDRMVREARPQGMPLIPDLPAAYGIGQEARAWLLTQYGPARTAALHPLLTKVLDADIEDYYRLAMYLSQLDLRAKIVDVGCGQGLQQVFFKDFAQYIGISTEKSDPQAVLQDNASFLQGDFAQLVTSGEFVIEPDMVGIANASLLYDEDNEKALALFKRFKRIVLV